MKECPKLVELGRRQFLRGGAVAAAGAAAVSVVAPAPARAAVPAARVDYPANRLANIKDLKVNEPMQVCAAARRLLSCRNWIRRVRRCTSPASPLPVLAWSRWRSSASSPSSPTPAR